MVKKGSEYPDVVFSNIAWSYAHLEWSDVKFWNFVLNDLNRRVDTTEDINLTSVVTTLNALAKIKYEPTGNCK